MLRAARFASPTGGSSLVGFVVGVEIKASPSRVWRALCDPAEVLVWDTGVQEAIDAPGDYPQPGQHVRWRYNNGPFCLLHDRPQEVVVDQKLRSLLAVGPFRFDETYTLEERDVGCHLEAKMDVTVPVPVLGWAVERLYLGPSTEATVAASLKAIKRHCEPTP